MSCSGGDLALQCHYDDDGDAAAAAASDYGDNNDDDSECKETAGDAVDQHQMRHGL